MDEHHVFNPKARQRFLDTLKRKPIAVDEAVVKAKTLLTQTIVSQLQLITAALKEYSKRIEELLKEFSDGNLFRSLPIAGLCLLISPRVDTILAAKLLAAIGTDRKRFSSANELQSFYRRIMMTISPRRHCTVYQEFWAIP